MGDMFLFFIFLIFVNEYVLRETTGFRSSMVSFTYLEWVLVLAGAMRVTDHLPPTG